MYKGGTMTSEGDDVAELIRQFSDPVKSEDGVPFVAQAWAELDDRWHGWLVFIAADGRILRTARETSHASRDALCAWAARLRPRALAAALSHAVPPSAERPAA
jgi:hypothetical protein